jgi:glycosyltransferase involved in cell wall biosynthesis
MMKKPLRVFVVVAAYNEEKRISAVLADLKRHGYRDVIVVDDHSRDKTEILAKRAGATVIRHSRNQGQGAALRTGITAALRKKADIIITFDGDGQHKAVEIKKLVAPILAGTADAALGSRFLGKAPGLPWYKWVTLKGSILVERVLLGVKLSDVHNGFRALSRNAARQVRITCDGMAHASEIVAEIHDKKISFVEVPVTISYDEYARKKGQSIFNSFRILREILRMKRARRKLRQNIY